MKALLELVRRHRAGEAVGIYSVCSAHPLALRAALEHARARDGYALIEATSNQVNQEGGYTGLRPAQFRDLVLGLADQSGLSRERVLLGGDHLGPNAWQSLPAEGGARARGGHGERVRARGIPQDPPRLLDVLCRRPAGCSRMTSWRSAPRRCAPMPKRPGASCGGEPPVYVVGTEVPVPGGAQETLSELAVTEPARRARHRHRASLGFHR